MILVVKVTFKFMYGIFKKKITQQTRYWINRKTSKTRWTPIVINGIFQNTSVYKFRIPCPLMSPELSSLLTHSPCLKDMDFLTMYILISPSLHVSGHEKSTAIQQYEKNFHGILGRTQTHNFWPSF